MLEEGNLDLRGDVPLLEGLEDVAERFGGGRAAQRRHVRVGGEINDGNVADRLNAFGRFDAVHRTGQPDVHQHKIGRQFLGRFEGVFPVGRDADAAVAGALEFAREIRGHDRFVFNDENVRLGHSSPPLPRETH